MKKVFLGGTCNGSTWRDDFIPLLRIDYFNPVVKNWTPADLTRELEQRKICDFCLYVITPKMTGVYSIAEVVDDSNKRPKKTLLVVLANDGGKTFDAHGTKSMEAVKKLVKSNGAGVFNNLNEAAAYLNKFK